MPRRTGGRRVMSTLTNSRTGKSFPVAVHHTDAAMDALFDRLNKIAKDYRLTAVWGVDGADDVFEAHPFSVATSVSFEADAFFNGKGGTFTAPIPDDGRWLDLWIAADKALKDSGDRHHVFIEGFVPTDDPAVLHIETGS